MPTNTNIIPGLVVTPKGTDHNLLRARLGPINRRISALESLIRFHNSTCSPVAQRSYKVQEHEAELAQLRQLKRETEQALNPPSPPPLDPDAQRRADAQRARDVAFLKSTIKAQTESLEWNAARCEQQGDHRAARAFRMQIPDVGGQACREFGKSPDLLAELEDPDDEKTPEARDRRGPLRRQGRLAETHRTPRPNR